jgi:hypothetical protein
LAADGKVIVLDANTPAIEATRSFSITCSRNPVASGNRTEYPKFPVIVDMLAGTYKAIMQPLTIVPYFDAKRNQEKIESLEEQNKEIQKKLSSTAMELKKFENMGVRNYIIQYTAKPLYDLPGFIHVRCEALGGSMSGTISQYCGTGRPFNNKIGPSRNLPQDERNGCGITLYALTCVDR